MSSKKFLSDLSIETRKVWKRIEELILLHIDENDEDSILELYRNSDGINNDIRSILLSSHSVKDKRASIFRFEIIKLINLLKEKYRGVELVNYLNCCDDNSGYNLMDSCLNGIYGRKDNLTYFVSGDWKSDTAIKKLLNKIGLKSSNKNINVNGGYLKFSKKKNNYLRRSKINRN
jgi:hypothetical protein